MTNKEWKQFNVQCIIGSIVIFAFISLGSIIQNLIWVGQAFPPHSKVLSSEYCLFFWGFAVVLIVISNIILLLHRVIVNAAKDFAC